MARRAPMPGMRRGARHGAVFQRDSGGMLSGRRVTCAVLRHLPYATSWHQAGSAPLGAGDGAGIHVVQRYLLRGAGADVGEHANGRLADGPRGAGHDRGGGAALAPYEGTVEVDSTFVGGARAHR